MRRADRETVLPFIEMTVVVVATAAAFYLGERYGVVAYLEALSVHSRIGIDVANLGPGLFVLACGLAVMFIRRWVEAARERRKLLETRDVLADSEARYRSLVEVSPAPMLLIDASLRIVFANEAALRLLRADDRPSLEGLPLLRIVHPESLGHVEARTASLLGGERLPAEEVRLRRLDGTDVVVQLLSVPVTIGGSPAIQSVLLDITHLAEMADALQQACIDTVEAMARLAETRDPYTSGHQDRVAQLAVKMAEHMGLDPSASRAVHVAGIIHDIGKINVPVEILSKPGKLTDTEFELIKTHVERGYEILRPIDFPWPIADIVRQHHERLDGSGYPLGVSGDQILVEGRILAVADVVEAVASNRPYRPALGLEAALQIIEEGRGTLFDPDCVDACIAVAREVITEG